MASRFAVPRDLLALHVARVVCSARQPAGFRPGMAGNFLLLAQKKVTKEEGLKSHLTAHLRRRVLLMASR
jgi:hypothetical protein